MSITQYAPCRGSCGEQTSHTFQAYIENTETESTKVKVYTCEMCGSKTTFQQVIELPIMKEK